MRPATLAMAKPPFHDIDADDAADSAASRRRRPTAPWRQVFGSAGRDGVVRLWGLLDRRLLASLRLAAAGRALAWAPDGRRLAGEARGGEGDGLTPRSRLEGDGGTLVERQAAPSGSALDRVL